MSNERASKSDAIGKETYASPTSLHQSDLVEFSLIVSMVVLQFGNVVERHQVLTLLRIERWK